MAICTVPSGNLAYRLDDDNYFGARSTRSIFMTEYRHPSLHSSQRGKLHNLGPSIHKDCRVAISIKAGLSHSRIGNIRVIYFRDMPSLPTLSSNYTKGMLFASS
jgi:hypothetical protein